MSDEIITDENQISIHLSEDMAEGTYSNMAIITHSLTEFVVDFVAMMPGIPQAKVKSRIVLHPIHAKKLLRALEDNISKYESRYGRIDEDDQIPGPGLMFSGPTGLA
ncbi:MAG: DUF3467 domain-containing protein [Bacteroidota bacterium]|nr:DUF3467 domain-containing protein [Bacteroidota bacterium]